MGWMDEWKEADSHVPDPHAPLRMRMITMILILKTTDGKRTRNCTELVPGQL